MHDETPDDVHLETREYDCAGGTEHFLQFVGDGDERDDLLVGFLRLRFPGEVVREELDSSAVVRELHVYGRQAAIGDEPVEDDAAQHRGYGERLMDRAEEIAADAGFSRLAVISGIGVRGYYRSLGYERDGPYMVKKLQ